MCSIVGIGLWRAGLERFLEIRYNNISISRAGTAPFLSLPHNNKMPKKKTHQATAKRFRISATGKFMKRTAGQDHFNARESGRTTMAKRRDATIADVNVKALRKLIPGT